MIRKALIKNFCHHCRKVLMPIEETNAKLSVGKRIDVVNCSDWENFGIKVNPIMDKIPKFEGYPHIYLDIFNITNVLSKEQVKAFLDGYFEKEKIIS